MAELKNAGATLPADISRKANAMIPDDLTTILEIAKAIIRLIPHTVAAARYAKARSGCRTPLRMRCGGKTCRRCKGPVQNGPRQEGNAMQSKRSTTFYKARTALTRWAANALRALSPHPTLPAAPRPWDGTGICTAVIRGGGTAHMATAALAYTGPDGKEQIELFRGYSTAGISGHAATSARINALAFLVDNPTNARATRLFIDDPALRREVAIVQESFPTLQLTTTAQPHLSIAASKAASRANSVTVYASAAAARLSLHNLTSERRTVIATDASIVPGKAGAGIAAVGSDGTVWQDRLPGTCDITWAELKAIHAAITHHPGKNLLVLSDSQGAVAFANGTAVPAQARMRRLAAQIQALRIDRSIEITWIRAHNGHPLNEAADAMARHARRAGAPAALAA